MKPTKLTITVFLQCLGLRRPLGLVQPVDAGLLCVLILLGRPIGLEACNPRRTCPVEESKQGRQTMEPHVMSGNHGALQQIYVGCSHEDYVTIEMAAWKRGYERAIADGLAVMRDLIVVGRASEIACDEALCMYVPMELNRFRNIFTLAWCGGYWTRVQESQKSVE